MNKGRSSEVRPMSQAYNPNPPEKCEWCGEVVKLERHHPDYSRPRDIIWVCRPCHGLIHSKKIMIPLDNGWTEPIPMAEDSTKIHYQVDMSGYKRARCNQGTMSWLTIKEDEVTCKVCLNLILYDRRSKMDEVFPQE